MSDVLLFNGTEKFHEDRNRILKWAKENWTVGQYTPSKTFKDIKNLSCVCKSNMELISLSGPAEDIDSQKLSDLVSQSPKLYELLEYLFHEVRLEISPEKNREIYETLRNARGGS